MTDQIPFNKPFIAGKEMYYMAKAVLGGHSAGDGPFTMKCQKFIEKLLQTPNVLLTQSYASALDMAAILCEAGVGDEVIMPSFASVSVANSFYMRGATTVFVDIRPDTLNIDETKIKQAVTKRTKAIVTPHYAGSGCEIKTILDIARRHKILVVEDAASGFGSQYEGKHLGTIGNLGVISFHETNNIMCGEGGAILINDERFIEKAEIIREKGTNRSKFFRGEVDKYTWVDIGSSFLPSDLVAAFLYGQLEEAEIITQKRNKIFRYYSEQFTPLQEHGLIRLPVCPSECRHNANFFYLLIDTVQGDRDRLIVHLKKNGINAVFHYIPLHTSPMGLNMGYKPGDLPVTEDISQRLVRLPCYYELTKEDQDRVIDDVYKFFGCSWPRKINK
jgi:dTDP-4-amino-4,6-dideoxygalactose transaminase